MKFDPHKLGKVLRPRWSGNRTLTTDDLRAEQAYQRDGQWQHNRMLHGYGIVSGLEVLVEPEGADGARVIVAPGYALDGWGRELVVPEPLHLHIPRDRRDLLLYLSYADAEGDADAAASVKPSTEDGVRLFFEPPPPDRVVTPAGRTDFAVPLTRLRRPHLEWQRDRTFRPPRTHN